MPNKALPSAWVTSGNLTLKLKLHPTLAQVGNLGLPGIQSPTLHVADAIGARQPARVGWASQVGP